MDYLCVYCNEDHAIAKDLQDRRGKLNKLTEKTTSENSDCTKHNWTSIVQVDDNLKCYKKSTTKTLLKILNIVMTILKVSLLLHFPPSIDSI